MADTDRDFAEWTEELKEGGRPRVYVGEALRGVAMSMGGIGAGQIALCGDGSLRQWQMVNYANHMAYVPDGFFAVWAKPRGGKRVVKLLQSKATYNDKGFQPAASVNDHVVPEEQKRLLRTLPGVQSTEFIGEYPIAEIAYKDAKLPVNVSLEAFSPFAPLDSKDSGLPAILFIFTVRNSGNRPVRVSLAGSLQNAVGWDGLAEIKGAECELYGGNRNEVVRTDGFKAVHMSNVILPTNAATNGTMTLAALEEGADALPGWTDRKTFWRGFSANGRLRGDSSAGPTEKGKTVNGAVAVPFALYPGEEKQVVFVMAWHFPNHYVNWGQKGFGVEDTKSCFWIGNMYNNWFANSQEVVEYVRKDFNKLADMTRLFRRTFYDSTLPYWLLDAVSSQVSTIRSPTCLWNEDGTFHGFEGCRGASTESSHESPSGGCCPLNCTHVWNYEQALAKVFPDLERTMRVTDLKVQMLPNGEIPHRTVLPSYLPRWESHPAADGQCGAILKAYREFLQCGDKSFLDELWLAVKKAMDYIFETWDQDGDGVMDGPQWNTYDCNVYGHNSFIGTLYLAALRACEEMAKIEGETDLAGAYRERYKKGRKIIEDELWNGEYYIQVYDAQQYKETQYGTGCLSDQLLGQWWAHVLGLGYVLDPERVRKALASIYKYNFRKDFVGFEQKPRIYACDTDKGLLCCTWPKGERPEGQAILYADEVWTGIEYQVAGHMLWEGMVDEAFHIIKAARDRYDGTKRNPWNEVECGDHYVRPMSSWWMLEAAAGYRWNGRDQSLAFEPRIENGEFGCFFVTDTGWGSFSESNPPGAQEEMLRIAYGEVTAKTLRFVSGGLKAAVELNGRAVHASFRPEGSTVVLGFTKPLVLKPGDTLRVMIE